MANKKPQARKKSGSRKLTSKGSGPVPPYGEAIRNAIDRGEVSEMRRISAASRKYLNQVQKALNALEKSIKDLER